jgi:2-beta-glucuronyltransferase
MISGHDYRSKRQANVHFIMRELEKQGQARFFSIGFSFLSLIKHDPRASLWSRSNQIEVFNGVECYLWKTAIHPFNLHYNALSGLELICFRAYIKRACSVLKHWVAEANTIILESGMAIIFYDLIKTLNPNARILYICSDALGTISCASFLSQELHRVAPKLDGVRVPSKKLVSEFTSPKNVFYVPHGMDADNLNTSEPSPYQGGINLVSVGSMLFDPSFFQIAASLFPEYIFHVIGGGKKARSLTASNIKLYDEMPFKETIAFIKHAQLGIAPYEGSKVSSYLVDTSMKLMQFEAFGLPAVCPYLAAEQHAGRFGYEPGNAKSIESAIRSALSYGRFQGTVPLSWAEVTTRILHPHLYSDTSL